MPLTVFDIKGVSGIRREHIEAAVVAGGRRTTGPYEAWIAADPFNGGFRVLITGPQGFERTVTFAIDDDPAVIGSACGRRWRGRGGTFGSQPSNVRLRCMAVQLHTYCQGKQKCGPTDYFLCLRSG